MEITNRQHLFFEIMKNKIHKKNGIILKKHWGSNKAIFEFQIRRVNIFRNYFQKNITVQIRQYSIFK